MPPPQGPPCYHWPACPPGSPLPCRLLGLCEGRVVYVESIARVYRLSLSGRRRYRQCNRELSSPNVQRNREGKNGLKVHHSSAGLNVVLSRSAGLG